MHAIYTHSFLCVVGAIHRKGDLYFFSGIPIQLHIFIDILNSFMRMA